MLLNETTSYTTVLTILSPKITYEILFVSL
nr:MAG TPA: hypothetical protein [Caudoviricetes sp.]